MVTRTGASATTGEKLILGAGKITIGGVTVGATRGGATFSHGVPLRDVEADGLQGATKGLVYKDKGNPTLSTTLLEINKANLVKLMPGYVISGNTIISNGQIKSTDYHDSVIWTGYRPESTGLISIELKNVLVKEPIGLQFSDNDEATVSVVFMAHYDLEETETADGYLPEPFVYTDLT